MSLAAFFGKLFVPAIALALLSGAVRQPALAQSPAAYGGSTGDLLLDAPPAYPSEPVLPPLLPAADTQEYVSEPHSCEPPVHASDWGLQVLPQGLIYRSYLAGPKESRMAGGIVRIPGDSWLWEATIGGRVGILRHGNSDLIRPCGFQFDVEASAQVRLDIPENVDVRSSDYRVGLPLTWGDEQQQWKFSYYHISSHLGDEFMEKNPDFTMFRQSRDALVFGYSRYLTDWLRVYGEVGWAFYSNASEPWEVQFGIDYAPRVRTGLRGAPFLAANGLLRQELDFGGSFTFQAGWAWRADTTAHLLRVGLQYYNGASSQYAFLPYHEQQIGLMVWYDF
jgi:hypothetical protein